MKSIAGWSCTVLKLKPLTGAQQARHFDLLSDRFYEGLAMGLGALEPGAPYHQDLMELFHYELSNILVGPPGELENIVLKVQGLHPAFSAYAARKKKGEDPANDIHRNTLTLIERCFDYGRFSLKSTSWNAYALVCAHNLRICPYCHAHHINYHVDPAAATLAHQYRVRPPLDHFLPKSSYPYLAVSLHNLIPSCAQCNSSIKSAADPLTLGVVNPHDGSIWIDIRFSAAGSIPAALKGTVDDIQIGLVANGVQSTTFMQAFLLSERYQWYRHEVKDLIDRYADHLSMPAALRKVVSRERFVLGCSLAQVDERMIGLCLRDIYNELNTQKLA
jgi:hypothetical protein